MGCGRVGIALAMRLQEMGHEVTVVDNNSESLEKLPPNFRGQKIVGFGFDDNTLTRAGAVDAFAFAAVTDNDNTNILAARVAREHFDVKKVVARVYSPERAELFERLGIPTVSTIKWTTDQVLRQMIPIGATDVFRDSTDQLVLVQVDYDDSWLTHTLGEIQELTQSNIAYLERNSKAFLPQKISRLQQNDKLFIFCELERKDKVSHILGRRYELVEKTNFQTKSGRKNKA
jgi:trk system potassium uptake protein TrkA